MGDDSINPILTEETVRAIWLDDSTWVVHRVWRDDGTPDRDAWWKVGDCMVLGLKPGSKPAIYVMLPDNEVYSIPLSQVAEGSIRSPGDRGFLVVRGWVYMTSLYPGARSHQPTFKRKCEILGWTDGDWRNIRGMQCIARPSGYPRKRKYEMHDWTEEAKVLAGTSSGGSKKQRSQPDHAPVAAPAAAPPTPPSVAQEVSSLAVRRVEAEERTGAAVDRLGDVLLCLGIVWLARGDKSDDGMALRGLATERLRRMMGG